MTSQNEVFAGRQFPAGDAKASLTEWRAQAEPEQDTAQIATSPQRAEDVAPEVFIEQIRLLYQHPVLILANIVNAALVVAVLWSSFPHPALLAWLALFLVLHSAPAARRAPAGASPLAGRPRGDVVRRRLGAHRRRWGLLAFAIVSTSDIAYQVFIVFVLGGMTAGAVLLDAAYRQRSSRSCCRSSCRPPSPSCCAAT